VSSILAAAALDFPLSFWPWFCLVRFCFVRVYFVWWGLDLRYLRGVDCRGLLDFFFFCYPSPRQRGGVALTLIFRRNFNPGFCGAMKSQGDRAGARMGMGGSDSNIIYFILTLRISREVLEYSYLYMVLVPVLDGGGVRGTGVILYSQQSGRQTNFCVKAQTGITHKRSIAKVTVSLGGSGWFGVAYILWKRTVR